MLLWAQFICMMVSCLADAEHLLDSMLTICLFRMCIAWSTRDESSYSDILLYPYGWRHKSCISLMILYYGIYGIFLIMGIAGFISSTVVKENYDGSTFPPLARMYAKTILKWQILGCEGMPAAPWTKSPKLQSPELSPMGLQKSTPFRCSRGSRQFHPSRPVPCHIRHAEHWKFRK